MKGARMPGAPGSNTGHGHVFERPDGAKARCGGPRTCSVCAQDLARREGQGTRLADARCGFVDCTEPLRYGVAVEAYVDAAPGDLDARSKPAVIYLCATHGEPWAEPAEPPALPPIIGGKATRPEPSVPGPVKR